MSTFDPVRGSGVGDVVRALIEEAWRRARRRRRVYAGVVLTLFVIGAVVLGTLRQPAQSPGVFLASPVGGGVPLGATGVSQHVYHGEFRARGKRGSFGLSLQFEGPSRARSWVIGPGSGQYEGITGRGHGFQVGGHAAGWSARITGFVKPAGAVRQKVVITLRGRPDGSFVLIPARSGVVKRDAGTQSSAWLG
jgi:hypothetical protein